MMTQRILLEYFKDNKILNPNFSNGKNINNFNARIHVNTKPKEYTSIHPDVDAVSKGKKNNVIIRGPRLQMLLKQYNLNYKPGVKGLGRTHVVLIMRDTNNGPEGIIKRK